MNNIRKQELKTIKAYHRFAVLAIEGTPEKMSHPQVRESRRTLKILYNYAVQIIGYKGSYFEFLKHEQEDWEYNLKLFLENE